jgi:hypothetical protein
VNPWLYRSNAKASATTGIERRYEVRCGAETTPSESRVGAEFAATIGVMGRVAQSAEPKI